ncbi:hypothetical protein, partial [Limosilactobacillus fermentum]
HRPPPKMTHQQDLTKSQNYLFPPQVQKDVVFGLCSPSFSLEVASFGTTPTQGLVQLLRG